MHKCEQISLKINVFLYSLGYIGVLLNYVCAPFSKISVSRFEDLAFPVCNYRNLEPNANSCPRSVWSNTTIYRENSFRKLDADHEFRLISSPTSAAGFLYLVNLFGRAAAPARFSKMKERGLCLTKFVTKLEEFAFWRHPTLMITRTSAHLLAGFDSTMQKLLSKVGSENVFIRHLLFGVSISKCKNTIKPVFNLELKSLQGTHYERTLQFFLN